MKRYLLMVKSTCSESNDEWKVRQQTRQEEITAVNEALGVLSNDDAHDMFTKTFNPSKLKVACET
jgi:hypothetical protein